MSAADIQPPPDASPAPRLSTKGRVGVGLLLAMHALLLFAAPAREGVSFDEPAHLVGGLAAWTTGDYRLAVNAFLPARWAALPLLGVAGLEVPRAGGAAWAEAEVYHTAFAVLGGREDRAELFGRGRSMIGLLSLLLGLLTHRIAFALHGEAGALLALALFAFSPTVLAGGRQVTADLAAALVLLAATWTTWRLLEGFSAGRLAAGCVAVAAAFLTKPSAVALVPIAAVLVLVHLLCRRPIALGSGPLNRRLRGGRAAAALAGVVFAHVAVVVLAAWTAFGFRSEATADPLARPAWEAELARSFAESGALGAALEAIDERHLLPEAFLHAYAHVNQHRERPCFLLGEFSTRGQPLFFPYLFAVKSALGLLLALLVAAAAALRPPSLAVWRDGLARTAPIWTLLFVYAGISIASGLTIGHRHLLPVYPALFILAGAGAAWLRHPRRLLRSLPLLPIAVLGCESLLAWPHHVGFFNVLHGGPSGAWRHVADSSLDWGQDLPRLAEWYERGAHAEPVHLSYFGTDDPLSHGIEATELYSYHPWTYRHGLARGFQLTPGLYVLSATMYRGLATAPLPPWTPEAEAEYRRLRALIDPAFMPETAPERVRALTGDLAWRESYLDLHQLRFVRLCRWLHLNRPEPDELATPAYLVWRLSSEDLGEALLGPPPLEKEGG